MGSSWRAGGKRDREETKNNTTEASMLLKTQGGSRNEAKKYMKTNGLLEISWKKSYKLLKTNNMAFLKAADFAALCRKNTRI